MCKGRTDVHGPDAGTSAAIQNTPNRLVSSHGSKMQFIVLQHDYNVVNQVQPFVLTLSCWSVIMECVGTVVVCGIGTSSFGKKYDRAVGETWLTLYTTQNNNHMISGLARSEVLLTI